MKESNMEANERCYPLGEWGMGQGLGWEWDFSFKIFFFFIFWLCHMACRILVPQPGIEPMPPAVEAQSPNCWTAREFLNKFLKFFFKNFEWDFSECGFLYCSEFWNMKNFTYLNNKIKSKGKSVKSPNWEQTNEPNDISIWKHSHPGNRVNPSEFLMQYWVIF